MHKPTSTYRIQFNKDFTFKSLDRIIPYLTELGIGAVYASPIFEAVPGSTHGYDTVNPHRINPEIGTEAELYQIAAKLKDAGISWLQDIVPNHMAFHQNNKWLMDVLKNGEESDYASFFDIDLTDNKKLMVPFLGEELPDAINNSSLCITENNNAFFLSYGGADWPVNRNTEKLLNGKKLIDVNEDKSLLSQIAEEQYYELCSWQETFKRINYRRFFTVNSLICLNIQNQDAFERYHRYIFKLVKDEVFQGLRIDHIDGLYDPKIYLDRLRNAVGEDVYIVVEKILEASEQLPDDWNAQGNTGYDFLAMVNNVFTNQKSKKRFEEIYQGIIGKQLNPTTLIHEKKESILHEHMKGELDNLYRFFVELDLVSSNEITSVSAEHLKRAIGEMMIQMPVYRYYDYTFPLDNKSAERVEMLLRPVMKDKKLQSAGKLLHKVFLEKPLSSGSFAKRIGKFYQRCMQFTGPLMAKGVEDTAMFTYNVFVGHSEVGDSPYAFGISTSGFHEKMIDRQKFWPLSLNASSTHDTKRGEDVRARLNVLSDLPDAWSRVTAELIEIITTLQLKNKSFKWLHKNDMYLMIQTILGALSMPGEDEDDISRRLEQYIEKALREAKKRSDWASPDEDYEQTVKDFTNALLDKNGAAFKAIHSFLNQIADYGIINSLSQLLLKFTCPGIPDVYQGTELWDLSLVDPDNRRAVDYEKRNVILEDIEKATTKKLWAERYSGKIKIWLTRRLSALRKEYREVFENGEYIPLEIKGKYKDYVLAFARKHKQEWIVVAVPLGIASLTNDEFNAFDWLNTQILLPENAPAEWKNLISGDVAAKDILSGGVLLSQVMSDVPVGLIKLEVNQHRRSAGILMHITSLPSAFGIGDLGKESIRFIDFLADASQKYWQILPVNPTKVENGHSPYSSNSTKAGNILMISPEYLHEQKLLTQKDIDASRIAATDKVDFVLVEELKHKLLAEAHRNFLKSGDESLRQRYQDFLLAEAEWLDAFALYMAIKIKHKGLEWFNWPNDFKKRNQKTILDFAKENNAVIEELKWQQFVFYQQWNNLRKYAHDKGVMIIGDLPFYVDLDSVEVWSEPHLFKLDKSLDPEKVAGVPPDYFNENGQLWGMPVFNWEKMKSDGYQWWISRLRKNLELFDLLRLDHFRAFSSFWEVNAGAENAINGTWMPGAGDAFFDAIKVEFPDMPFIAEDLGDITNEIEQLRDQFGLPGMKVLQFAFGDDLVSTPHIPHNFTNTNCIAYSGTHDNNTMLGWFNKEANEETKKRMSKYFGVKPTVKNINSLILRFVYSSVAKVAILPIQDLLDLDEKARMNIPGNINENWSWRVNTVDVNANFSRWISEQVGLYGRK